tara:strand:+ start:138 stop:830 length:693 start_codon:yes stop_codon:yes gene_type:complete
MKKQKVLILGNKPYYNFRLDKIIDSFDIIYRCNLAQPGKNTGTKFGRLALCSHVYNYFVKNPVEKDQIMKIYGDEYTTPYLTEWYDFFHENKQNFEKIYYQNECKTGEWNRMLEMYGSPYRFTAIPSTGHSTIFENLLNDNNEIYVLGFTLLEKETRVTIGDLEEETIRRNNGQTVHSFSDERNILAWLHNNNKIDASLCMLEDKKDPSFKYNEHNMEPSKFILNLLDME